MHGTARLCWDGASWLQSSGCGGRTSPYSKLSSKDCFSLILSTGLAQFSNSMSKSSKSIREIAYQVDTLLSKPSSRWCGVPHRKRGVEKSDALKRDRIFNLVANLSPQTKTPIAPCRYYAYRRIKRHLCHKASNPTGNLQISSGCGGAYISGVAPPT